MMKKKTGLTLLLCLLLAAGSMSACGIAQTAPQPATAETAETAGDTQSEETTATAEETTGVDEETTGAAEETTAEAETTAESTTTDEAATEETTATDSASMLSYWTDTAKLKSELVSYMDAITAEGSADFIPVEDRIAVFDFDGTLFCETDPNYFDYTLLRYRVLEDPDYIDKASDFEKEVAEKITRQNETGESFEGLEVDHGKAVASSFAGMTLAEMNAYIQEFKKQDMPSYDGMKRGDGFYLPMLQVIDYLQANDFTVYIVSGTDRFIVRGIIDGSGLNIPPAQIIGSDESLVATSQGDEDGRTYTFTPDDSVILGGEFLIKNLKMNKVTVINQEIGKQPVLSFGNSSGDGSMAEFVISHNPHKSLAFMLCCDDLDRENGNIQKAEKMEAMCEEYGWIPVSMKNDWTTIYGDSVTYKKQ